MVGAQCFQGEGHVCWVPTTCQAVLREVPCALSFYPYNNLSIIIVLVHKRKRKQKLYRFTQLVGGRTSFEPSSEYTIISHYAVICALLVSTFVAGDEDD